ncbi:MAG: hypothetical protein ACLTYW_03725 [Collinsella sp.]
MPESDLDALLKLSGDIDGVHKVRVYGRIGQMALNMTSNACGVLDALGRSMPAIAGQVGYVMQLEPRKHKLVWIWPHCRRPYARAGSAYASACGVCRGRLHDFLRAAFRARAAALTVPCSMLGHWHFVCQADVIPRARQMFLLNVGELLEDYTAP